MKRKNYIIFIRHLKKIKDLVDFYEYIADSRVCAIAIYLFLIVCSPFIALLFPIAYIEHCIYKKRFIRKSVEYDWCSKEYFEDVVDIKKIESEEF
ncbi:hypothetical protein [Streptococcus sp. 11-4097]|uniref:hypothetical protein n=1 Tax=Streptococcus sp. 11-4097 TaxID=2828286 RepID=UPI001BAFFBA3|nr:hypothetical protein [Streptococcus sp. 11-4097]